MLVCTLLRVGAARRAEGAALQVRCAVSRVSGVVRTGVHCGALCATVQGGTQRRIPRHRQRPPCQSKRSNVPAARASSRRRQSARRRRCARLPLLSNATGSSKRKACSSRSREAGLVNDGGHMPEPPWGAAAAPDCAGPGQGVRWEGGLFGGYAGQCVPTHVQQALGHMRAASRKKSTHAAKSQRTGQSAARMTTAAAAPPQRGCPATSNAPQKHPNGVEQHAGASGGAISAAGARNQQLVRFPLLLEPYDAHTFDYMRCESTDCDQACPKIAAVAQGRAAPRRAPLPVAPIACACPAHRPPQHHRSRGRQAVAARLPEVHPGLRPGRGG